MAQYKRHVIGVLRRTASIKNCPFANEAFSCWTESTAWWWYDISPKIYLAEHASSVYTEKMRQDTAFLDWVRKKWLDDCINRQASFQSNESDTMMFQT